jgi:hypothetical protein
MIVSDQQIEYIKQSLILYGVNSKDLREDLLDHICTYIETDDSSDFDTLYQEALQKFGGYANFQNLQRESHFQKFTKALITLNKLKFTIGFTTTLLLIVSLIFKMMHWPYANVLMIGAVALFTLIILPIHYYTKYKKSIYQLS